MRLKCIKNFISNNCPSSFTITIPNSFLPALLVPYLVTGLACTTQPSSSFHVWSVFLGEGKSLLLTSFSEAFSPVSHLSNLRQAAPCNTSPRMCLCTHVRHLAQLGYCVPQRHTPKDVEEVQQLP